MIFDMLETTPYTTNCYLIGDEETGSAALVDPGGNREKLLDMVGRRGLRLEKIFLTHGHYDHVKEAASLAADAPGLAVYIHRADTGKGDARLFPPLAVDPDFYGEGDVLAVGGLTVRVLHTPGHSAGSVTLLVEDVMLCGDTLFAGSCGRFDFPDGSQEKLFASLARLGRLEKDYKVCPGHGPASTLDYERLSNPYMKHAMRL